MIKRCFELHNNYWSSVSTENWPGPYKMALFWPGVHARTSGSNYCIFCMFYFRRSSLTYQRISKISFILHVRAAKLQAVLRSQLHVTSFNATFRYVVRCWRDYLWVIILKNRIRWLSTITNDSVGSITSITFDDNNFITNRRLWPVIGLNISVWCLFLQTNGVGVWPGRRSLTDDYIEIIFSSAIIGKTWQLNTY